jgi:hypothetical protein
VFRTIGFSRRLHPQRSLARASRARHALFVLLLSALGLGCSRAVEPTNLDSKDAAARAMAEYDTNHDGYLDAKELARCPGLKSVLKQFDLDGDGRLSEAEIEAGLTSIQEAHAGLVNEVFTVTLDGVPLVGASVSLEPDSFLGDRIKPAQGTTNDQGRVQLKTEGAPAPGCNVGLFRVRISKKDGDRETIPARYNTETELGLGVGAGLRKGTYTFHLSTR